MRHCVKGPAISIERNSANRATNRCQRGRRRANRRLRQSEPGRRDVHALKMATRKFTRAEIEARNHKGDAVIIIDNVVYDVTQFLDDHPGGAEVLIDNAGRDASQCFNDVGHTEDAREYRKRFAIGEVVDAERWEVVKPKDQGWSTGTEPMTVSGMISVWAPPLTLAALAVYIYVHFLS